LIAAMAPALASSSPISPLSARAWKWPARLTAVSTRPRVAASFSAIRVRRSATSSSAMSTSTASTPSRVNRVSLREIPMRDSRSDMGGTALGRMLEDLSAARQKSVAAGGRPPTRGGHATPDVPAGRRSELLPVAPGRGGDDRGRAAARRGLRGARGCRVARRQLYQARRALHCNRRLVVRARLALIPYPEHRDRLHQLPGLLLHAARGRRGFLDQGCVLLRVLVHLGDGLVDL